MNKLTPQIISWAQQGVVPAALKIAAAMEESGLGAACPPGSNNWFGRKDPSGVQTETKEQTSAGVWYTIKAGFRVYKTPADGFADYDKLISTSPIYAAAWKVWLASKQTNADVETLTSSIAIRYATALSYAKALVSIEVADKLFGYDKPTDAPVATAVVNTATRPAAPSPTLSDRMDTLQDKMAGLNPPPQHEGFVARMEALWVEWEHALHEI